MIICLYLLICAVIEKPKQPKPAVFDILFVCFCCDLACMSQSIQREIAKDVIYIVVDFLVFVQLSIPVLYLMMTTKPVDPRRKPIYFWTGLT